MSETNEESGLSDLLCCPKCGNSAELYPYDADGKEWRISCNNKWQICNFELGCTDRFLLKDIWNSVPREA